MRVAREGRCFVVGMLLALPSACDDPPKPTEDKAPTTSATTPVEGPSSVTLPAVAAPTSVPSPEAIATVWIATDGVWLGRAADAATRVMTLEEGRVGTEDPQWLGALATALHTLERPKPTMFAPAPRGPRGEGLRLIADASTDGQTVRRVVTAARAVGYNPIHFATAPDKALEMVMNAPVLPRHADRFETPLLVALAVDGGMSLNAQPLSRSELRSSLSRQLGFRDRKCVTLKPADTVPYTKVLETGAWLAELEVDCLTVHSTLAPADDGLTPPPPPPPPPSEEDADEDPLPPIPPAPPESKGRKALRAWWSSAREDAEERSAADCAKRLSEARERFEAADGHNKADFVHLASLEDECGDATRARAIRVQRTDESPNDWQAWHSLGVADFGPLWPDPAKGEQFNSTMQPRARLVLATRALESFDKAIKLGPTEHDPHTWAAMCLIQRMLSREPAADGSPSKRARMDEMDAWRHRKRVCELSGQPCPEPPMTQKAYEALAGEERKR